MDDARHTLRIAHGLAGVNRAQWDSVANPEGLPYDPFLSWDFLEALERSQAADAGEGWAPHHLLLEGAGGELVAAMPLYLKSHSYGEFVFDHSWAEAFQRAGGRYYPKLLGAVPFTPVTGRRWLVRPGQEAGMLLRLLLASAVSLTRENGLSTLHVNFLSEADAGAAQEAGFLIRTDQQFHFHNPGYASFDDFLAELSSDKRKNLRKERAKAQDGVRYLHLAGDDITEAHWDRFYDFYMDTGARKWGTPYLNRETFALIGERMADKVLLIMAEEDGEIIAGAMNMIGSDALYGRYWGTLSPRPFLHFETCYYQAMDWAIANGMPRVEAGAQGGHKLARGYEPMTTYSAHWIANPGFRRAIADYLAEEREAVEADKAYLRARTPFKKDGESGA